MLKYALTFSYSMFSDEVHVALQRSVYTVREGDGMIQICAVVNSSYPIGFNFNISVLIICDDMENALQGL